MKRYLLLTGFLFSVMTCFSQNSYREVTLAELMKKKKSGDKNMIIVDVRTRGEYGDSSRSKNANIGRIKGAVNIPLQELMSDSQAIHRFDSFKDKDIYLICSHSYRSRAVSNMLLRNGFTHVNNTRGGMTEWYRRYDELLPYRNELETSDIHYKDMAPAELLGQLEENKTPLLIGIQNKPRMIWDSATVRLFKYFPLLKQAEYYAFSDSLKVLELVRKEKRPVVLFNMVNTGAAELAEWLNAKGITNSSYLVGGITLLYEYSLDKIGQERTNRYFVSPTSIDFITPSIYCKYFPSNGRNMQIIDVREDSIFNKIVEGVKHSYSHLKGAANFPSYRSMEDFEKIFPDKGKSYLFFNAFGPEGIELADALSKTGYKIKWMIGGYDRWEWFMNNMENFNCQDMLIEK